MNKARLKKVRAELEIFEKLLSDWQIETGKSELESIRDEEDAYFNELSEKAQDSDKGQASEQAHSELQEAFDAFEEINNAFETLVAALQRVVDASA